MLARAYSAGLDGVEGYRITIEADVGVGLPCLTIVGRISGALHEARERVRSALGHCGHPIPPRRQLVNLAPADQRKDSPGLDLGIACALLAAHGVIEAERLADTLLWGELALDGTLRPAAGTLVVADAARADGFRQMVVAPESAAEARLVPGIEVAAATSLPELIAHLRDEDSLEVAVGREPPPTSETAAEPDPRDGHEILDMADVRGLALPRRAVEIMVAGGHNLLLHGPPGVGKTMLARRVAGLLPPLTNEDALTVTKIHGVARGSTPTGLIRRPPVRMPHHTVSAAGLLGGGSPPRPGEVSLAHRGVLFLDELPEFPRACVEGLREPLEDGAMTIVRAQYAVHFPARFQLMATMNPCPCGYLGHPERTCVDSPHAVRRYQSRVSGPFLDRMDLLVPVTPLTPAELAVARPGEPSAVIRERIVAARARQRLRLRGTPWTRNADIPASGDAIERHCALEPDAERLLLALADKRGASMRSLHRMRRVARTIADLESLPDADPNTPIPKRAIALAARLRQPPDPG